MRVGHAHLDRRSLSLTAGVQHVLAERLVLAPIRDQLGLSRLRRAYTGGAALGPDALRFFRALGVNLKQVYGQTEIGGLSMVHRDDAVDPETVGQPIANTEVRLSESSEILSRSDGLFLGYYKNREATAAALRDGWLHSGDAGLLAANGDLVVLDRVKDMAVLADGRPFAPQYIENKLKFSPYVKEAVAVGHERPYVAALLNIDMATVGKWAENHNLAYTTYTDLAQKPEVYTLVADEVRHANATLPDTVRVQRFALLHKELDADDDEVTRTRKIRRQVITERYADIIDALYDTSVDAIQVSTEVQYQDRGRALIEAQLRIFSLGARSGLSYAG
jgi:long-chain acyl-CoA synthetase